MGKGIGRGQQAKQAQPPLGRNWLVPLQGAGRLQRECGRNLVHQLFGPAQDQGMPRQPHGAGVGPAGFIGRGHHVVAVARRNRRSLGHECQRKGPVGGCFDDAGTHDFRLLTAPFTGLAGHNGIQLHQLPPHLIIYLVGLVRLAGAGQLAA